MAGRPIVQCLVATGMALSCGPAAAAQASGAAPAPDQLFGVAAPLELTLTAHLRAVTQDRGPDRRYHLAVLSFTGPDGKPVSLNIRVRTRGLFRLKPTICQFPPLLLDLPRKAPAHTVFAGQHKLKLATHCQNHRDEYEQYIVQEYLIYRAYALFTERSLRTRLAHVTYVDSAGREPPLTKSGFLIEDEQELAARTGTTLVDTKGLLQQETDSANMTLVAVFQYMVGNTDWSVWGLHNIKLLADSAGVLYAVPYDFDWSGVIGTAYAKPDARLPIQSVRQRLFRGACRTPEQFAAVFTLFQAKRDTLYALYRNEPALSDRNRERSLRYYDAFYQTITDPRAIKREFLQACGNQT